MNHTNSIYRYLGGLCFVMWALLMCINCGYASAETVEPIAKPFDYGEVEREIDRYVPDPQYVDDRFILVALKEAVLGSTEHNGGIGACLVNEETGEIVARSHNQQYEPYFRSALHAEMVLLDQYEERMRFTRLNTFTDFASRNPRINMKGLILYTSVEPCPMCLTRIINSGVKKVYYAAPDDSGGMAHRIENLPPFWQGMAQGMVVESARCSPVLKELAQSLFHPMKVSVPPKK